MENESKVEGVVLYLSHFNLFDEIVPGRGKLSQASFSNSGFWFITGPISIVCLYGGDLSSVGPFPCETSLQARERRNMKANLNMDCQKLGSVALMAIAGMG